MVATFTWKESNGAGETVSTATNLNFGNVDSVDIVTANYPITIGQDSYEKYIRPHFSGAFTSISNVQFWKSSGAFVTGETILWKNNGISTYVQPTSNTSTVATTAVPTSDPGYANVAIANSTSASLSSEGYTDYIVLQQQTSTSASAGATNTKTFTVQYDES